jgi:hypothetical protein
VHALISIFVALFVGLGQPGGPAPAMPSSGPARAISCPSAPDLRSTRAATERFENCEDAATVQELLLASGAIAANVQVSRVDSGQLLGPDRTKRVVAQVFLPAEMGRAWDATAAIRAISRAVGAPLEHVVLTDDRLEPIAH